MIFLLYILEQIKPFSKHVGFIFVILYFILIFILFIFLCINLQESRVLFRYYCFYKLMYFLLFAFSTVIRSQMKMCVLT